MRTSSTQDKDEGERVAKVIARAGLCSRRDAEKLIADGRVALNGKTLDSPAVNVTAKDKVTVDGKPLPAAETVRLWRYHKPKGRVTTHRDPQERPTVFEALPPEMPRVISVGRLDFNTEGLLLLTNDGALARHLESPANGWLRRYRVRAHGDITQAELDVIAKGIEIDGIRYGPIEAKLDRVKGNNCWITLGIREGKNREVRRIMEHLRLEVTRLIRLSFGPFMLGDLEPGAVEEIKRRVIVEQLGPESAAKLGLARKDGAERGGAPKSAGGRAEAKPRRPGPAGSRAKLAGSRGKSEGARAKSEDRRPKSEPHRPEGHRSRPEGSRGRPGAKGAKPAGGPSRPGGSRPGKRTPS